MTQRAVADACGVHFTYVSKLENGANDLPCSEALLRSLADIYGCDTDELIALAGRCPEDIVSRIGGDLTAIKTVRRALHMA
jgi:transcriptional regulator with XRE-family HTH domain